MFLLWKRTVELEGKAKPPYLNILNKASTWYHNLKIAGEWHTQDVHTSDSAFLAEKLGEVVPCYECGQKGHKRTNCPLLKQKHIALTTGPTSRDQPIGRNPLRYEKKIGGKDLKWCGKCGGHQGTGKWKETHFTDEHIAGGPNELGGRQN